MSKAYLMVDYDRVAQVVGLLKMTVYPGRKLKYIHSGQQKDVAGLIDEITSLVGEYGAIPQYEEFMTPNYEEIAAYVNLVRGTQYEPRKIRRIHKGDQQGAGALALINQCVGPYSYWFKLDKLE